jgi:hypothetical protein
MTYIWKYCGTVYHPSRARMFLFLVLGLYKYIRYPSELEGIQRWSDQCACIGAVGDGGVTSAANAIHNSAELLCNR